MKFNPFNTILLEKTLFKIFSAFLLSFNSLIILAQPVNNYAKDVVMPAPNAAALGKYGDYTVGNFTGVPDISIPIYTVQEGSLNLPISLSYHASGIKVAEMASWVGAGWSLNAGGIITRTVQGIRDEHAYGYFNTASLLENRINQAGNNYNLNKVINDDISNNQIDGEPDLFSFNVSGYTGKFYIDKNHNVQIIPRQDVKVEIDGSLQGFTIIPPNGTRYTFGRVQELNGTWTQAYEQSLMQDQSTGDKYITSWYLLRIETSDKKYSISFSYDNEGYSYLNAASGKYTSQAACGNSVATKESFSYYTGIDGSHYTFRTYLEGKRLTQIKSGSGTTINFMASTIRNDMDDDKGFTSYGSSRAKALDTIQINTGGKCQQFNFSYSYFQDNTKPALSTALTQKLKLDALTQRSCDGVTTIPPYIFNYEGSFLPYRLHKGVDHWGYYNGVLNNENNAINVPPTNVQYPGSNLTVSYGLSNRESNEIEMKKGVLKEITYPTGGKTTFTLEANTVGELGLGSPQPLLNLKTCSSAIGTDCCGSPTTNGYYTFASGDLTTNTSIKFTLNITRPVNTSGGGSLCSTYDPVGRIYIYDMASNLKGSLSIPLLSQSFYSKTDVISYIASNLQEGVQYRFELSATNAYVTFDMTKQTMQVLNKTIGGLRVKEIKSSDGVNTSNDIVKQYDYSEFSSAGVSSGRLLRKPQYGNVLSNIVITDDALSLPSSTATVFMINDESIVPLYTFEGNHIGYRYVRETTNGNGSKLYNYNAEAPTPDNYNNPNPYPAPPLAPIPSNGQVVSENTYSQNNITLKTIVNSKLYENPIFSIGKIRKLIKVPFTCTVYTGSMLTYQATLSARLYTDYQIRTLPYRLASVTETIDGVTTTTDYTYSTDATQPLFPLTTSVTNSDGKTIVTTNKYITHTDYNTDPVATRMKQLNIIADPVEVTTIVGGVQVNGSRTKYGFFDNASGTPVTNATNSFPYPYQFYKYKMTWNSSNAVQVLGTNSGWDLEGTITQYDMTKGKPLSINLRGWENATATNATEKYTWDATNGLIKTRQFKGFTWQYEYLPNTRLVSKITDKDGQFVTYDYDHLQRVKTASARNGSVVTTYNYTYKDPNQSNKNWVETKTTFSSAIGGSLSNNTTFKTVRQYMDGLGRPIQSVAVANSPNAKDVISVVEYDNQGREFKKYDPFESTNTNGAFVGTLPTNQLFTKLEYEASPLNRIWKTTPPNWQATIMEYGTNASGEAYDMTGETTYPANVLYRTTVTDPDGRVSRTYKDKKGRVVYTFKTQNNVTPFGSYMIYSYDDKDRVNKVYPQRNAWQEWVYNKNLDYAYRYDWNDNMIWKQLPDISPITMQYNARNQLVLMQDGKQASTGQWLATQYDDYGRPMATGFAINTALNATTFNPTLSSTLTTTEYSAVAGTSLGKPIRTKNYLGTYLESYLEYDVFGRLANTYSNNQLYTPSSGVPISATHFSEKIALTYDLADNILTKTRTHKPNATTTRTIVETTDYDNGLRLKQIKHKLDAMTEQVLSYNDYNAKNQLVTKWVGKAGALNYLQKMDYAYNSVGWLTGINPGLTNNIDRALSNCFYPAINLTSTTNLDINDLFSLELKYNDPIAAYAPSGTTVKPEYGGNISQVVWKVKGREKQVYSLKYDPINRMTEAIYSDISMAGAVTGNRYDEKLTYDVRGNIKTLQRWGLNGSCTWGMIDNLTYNYGNASYLPKNQLQSVTDNSDLTRGFKTVANGSTYTYDNNGNLTADPNKAITSIIYNHLNLPTTITFTNSRSITFMYDAGGNKLRKTVVQSGVTQYTQDYVGGIEYRNGVLEAIYHAEGRITNVNTTLKYEYAFKDHLGNTRLMFSDKNNDGVITQSSVQESNEVTQEQHYYPFGLSMEGTWQNTPSISDNKYQYNGKEFNDDFGLNWNDYGARFYDAAIGQWRVVDPLLEIHRENTPYSYVLNNPINFIDPNGMEEEGVAIPEGGYRGTVKGRSPGPDNGGTTVKGDGGLLQNIGGFEGGKNDKQMSTWMPLSKNVLEQMAHHYNYCQICDDNDLGAFFELLFEGYVTGWRDGNGVMHPPAFTGFGANFRRGNLMIGGGLRNTRPDFTSNGYWFTSEGIQMKKTTIPEGVWYELKAKEGNLYRSTDPMGDYQIGQLEGHIQNLYASMRRYAKTGYTPHLVVYTTSDVKISPVLSQIASGFGIKFSQLVPQYRFENGKYDIQF